MSDLWVILGGVAALLATIAGAFFQGKSAGRKEVEHAEIEEDLETAIRIDRVRASDTANAARMRLAERKPDTDL